jgi:hypothetical protein
MTSPKLPETAAAGKQVQSIFNNALGLLIFVNAMNITSYAQDMNKLNHLDVFSMCSKQSNHSTLYDYGKRLAEGWLYWLKTETKAEKEFPTRTKKSFITSATMGYTKKYKIMDTSPIYWCFSGYNSKIKDETWSSAHQGLVDYLPSKHKKMFLSLPER